LTAMIQSMTGFGSAEKNGLRVEIRSLNHRFMDITIKTPSCLSQYDLALRNMLKEKFQRGKFDVTVLTENHAATQVTVNKETARKIYSAFQELQKELAVPGQIDINMLAGYEKLLVEEKPEYDVDNLYAAFHEAISRLEAMRVKEGNLIAEEQRQRAKSLKSLNGKVRSLMPHLMERYKARFSERVRLLLEPREINDSKIIQEAAAMLEKLDISEEVNRIENHIQHVKETLREGNVIGRKLDFLLQEIGRETNTIAAKSSDSTVSSLTVDMKLEIERMREQVQNLQ
jgi:uncharacterized protein (TIGR00255 family)